MIKLIVAHSILATITVLTNSVVIDMIFMSVTFVIVVKLLMTFRHLCLEKRVEVEED
jgi:hypothetical protein